MIINSRLKEAHEKYKAQQYPGGYVARPKLSDEELKYNAKMCGIKYREKNKETLKLKKMKYDDDHKEERKAYDKERRIKNEKKLKKVIECECGGKSIFENLHHHRKTKRHMTYLKYQEDLLKK